jgi:hypothetical protein
MARTNRHSTDAIGENSYPAIVNQGYVSDYFLSYRLDAGLADLYAAWEERERGGDKTPRTRMKGLSSAFARERADAAEAVFDDEALDAFVGLLPERSVSAQRALNKEILDALGWNSEEVSSLKLMSGDTEIEIPAAHVCSTASGPLLVAIQTTFATDPSTIMASKDGFAGTLLDPVMNGEKIMAATAFAAVQLIFTADDAPTYVLVCSGGSLTLLDRNRWGEGVYLGCNLDDAVARADGRPKGELAAIAALFSADAIDPGTDATSPLTTLLEKATNESAGVSKELRHGVRRSVELLANAVIKDVRYRQKGAWQQIDPEELTRECLRYLYRIIVLLFAEARPELGILPVGDADYQDGYSLSRLRDVALVDLHSEQATESTHIQDSLKVLFDLVNSGYQPEDVLGGVRSIEFPGLSSILFAEDSCKMLDKARLPDFTMQQVMSNLCFTRPQRGRARQSLSYATLGINQLGAVYEGLMAFRGFLATEALFEVDNDGDADNGTWVIPVSKADEFSDEVFLTEEGPDGVARRVTYSEGDFVFRLAGRDRQRSASFYTPEVLTEFTVRHALDVYEEENPELSAADWLNVTICEPALGSGAFANEAVNQVAIRYLKSVQQEKGETIDPETYQLELQKAKAHFAINRTYGVDLNRTAVELAEVSAWLNCMHEGLEAPQFDARLRRGNSLIGARRSTYTEAQLQKAPWKGTSSAPVVPPADQPLSEVALGTAPGIHHFLVPGEGWGCAAGAVELKGKKSQPGLAEEWAEKVGEWRNAVLKAPNKSQIARLKVLARRVEKAWADAARFAADFQRAHDRRINVWGADPELLPEKSNLGLSDFLDPEGVVARLRLIMDAWCALWMWAPANGDAPPTLDKWLDAIELLLGQPTADETQTLFAPSELEDGTLDSVRNYGTADVAEVLGKHPWLVECQKISDTQAFFHWELEFADVFINGGFEIQVGNPPWVRLDWDEPSSLAESDPWWAIADLTKTSDSKKRDRRTVALSGDFAKNSYQRDRAENEAISALLGSSSVEPKLSGLRTNLYMNFMANTWRRGSADGVVGLIHPESHFVDPKAGSLRSETYQRLRRHWQFVNEAKLFVDVHNNTEFGVHIYSEPRSVHFQQAANLLTPLTLDRSLDHDGTGDLPSIQYAAGGWDLRPHLGRIVEIDETVLGEWVRLFDAEGTPALQSRLLRPLTNADLGALSTFARQPVRLGESERYWTSGFNEKNQKDDGTFEWRTDFPEGLDDCILQGPHILNATPFAQQPRENCRSNKDWEALNLETLPADFVPRTNYQRLVNSEEFVRRQTQWGDASYATRYREVHREFVGSGSVRTLQACLIPPGPPHLYKLNSIALQNNRQTAIWAASLMSLPYDYLVKVSGVNGIGKAVADGLKVTPAVRQLDDLLLLRVLRLNCIHQSYSSLWEELYEESWRMDEFEAGPGIVSLAADSATWGLQTALRTDLDRWLALCELDSIVALKLGLSEQQLLQMYRAQFAVLRKYEYVTVFDANGRQISGDYHNHGFVQAEWEAELKEAPVKRGERRIGMWDRVQAYMNGDTSVDLGPFVGPFVPADREAAMSKAYRAFEQRLAES